MRGGFFDFAVSPYWAYGGAGPRPRERMTT